MFFCLPNIGKYTSNSFSENTVGHNIRLGSQNSKYVIWSNYYYMRAKAYNIFLSATFSQRERCSSSSSNLSYFFLKHNFARHCGIYPIFLLKHKFAQQHKILTDILVLQLKIWQLLEMLKSTLKYSFFLKSL